MDASKHSLTIDDTISSVDELLKRVTENELDTSGAIHINKKLGNLRTFVIKSYLHKDPYMKKLAARSRVFQFGWGNGYVAFPKGHKLYGLQYSVIEEKHGQLCKEPLTYSGYATIKDVLYWVIGFDTAHAWNDNTHNKRYVLDQTEALYKSIARI